MNVGYLEALKHEHFGKLARKPDCFAFHDVDLLPDWDNNLYMCHPEKSIHLCDKLNKYSYKTQYNAGGHVSAGGAVHTVGFEQLEYVRVFKCCSVKSYRVFTDFNQAV